MRRPVPSCKGLGGGPHVRILDGELRFATETQSFLAWTLQMTDAVLAGRVDTVHANERLSSRSRQLAGQFHRCAS
jgi:hypothetical protein